MLIENKWAVYDGKDDIYYTGDNDSGDPVLESLNSRVRLYKNEKGAKGAIRHIEHSGSERVEFCELKAVYIERQDVPDVPGDDKDKHSDKPGQASDEPPKEPPVIKNDGNWIIVDSFGRIKYVKKTTTSKPFFGVIDENGDLRGFGFDELAAWTWYSDRRRDVGIKLIQDRKDNNVSNGR